MNKTSRNATDIVHLLERVQMSPGERARARARVEQVEAFLDLLFATAARVHDALTAASATLSALAHRMRGMAASQR